MDKNKYPLGYERNFSIDNNLDPLEQLEIQVRDFSERCFRIKQRLSEKEKEESANSVAVKQEFAIKTK
tara:strand:+ start:780 stop:983 length:204 start_codon:yes stop_codon:yes gene_type:complete